MSPGFLSDRVVHVHPTLQCNLTCLHCYSSSSPQEHRRVDAGDLLEALATLRGEGYEALSVSGGEPFLYPGLDQLVVGAAGLGYKVNVITNGTVLSPRRLERMVPSINFVAVSVDGAPQNHDRIRGREGAFARAERGLETLRQLDVKFGITFCVTRSTFDDVPWVYEFAQRTGAYLLNLRPLALVGRANSMGGGEALEDVDCTRLMLLAQVLDSDSTVRPRVHVDLAPVAWLAARKQEDFPILRDRTEETALGDLVNPLVIDEFGRLYPFAYGVSRDYEMGSIGGDLSASIDRFKSLGVADVRGLVAQSFETMAGLPTLCVDWFDLVTHVSHQKRMLSDPTRSMERAQA